MIPRKVRVGAHTYEIGSAAAPDLGHCDSDNLRINVAPHQAESQKQSTLLHELLHAIANDTGLKEKWGDEEEYFVTALEGGLSALLRRNPRLVEYLTE